MASDRPLLAAVRLVLPLAALVALAASAQPAAGSGRSGAASGVIFTCTAPDGRRLTSDRPIAACRGVEQRVLNPDGSLQRIVPPATTAEERAAREAQERQEAAQRRAQLDAARRDRNLLQRYPDEAAHQRARESALETVRLALRASEQRLQDLQRERQPLIDETEFYPNRELPPALRQRLAANDAAQAAQRHAIETHRAELDRLSGIYDAELHRLRRLWAGAAPGSLAPAQPLTPTPVSVPSR
jgi:hypothetical protein